MSGPLAAALAYLVGSVPFGWLAYRLRRRGDIRRHGSGNIGAANVGRLLGARLGLLVLGLDAAKGALGVQLGRLGGDGSAWPAACGLAALVGHVFPVSLGFRGGKGVATGLGAFACLAPLAAGVAVLVFLAVLAVSRIVSLGSLSATLGLVAAVLAERGLGPEAVAAVAGTVLIWLRHAGNLARLARGAEPRLGGGSRP